jgi:hypothetical protein
MEAQQQPIKAQLKVLSDAIKSKDLEISKLIKMNSQLNKKNELLQSKLTTLTDKIRMNKKPSKIMVQEQEISES